MYVYRVCAWCPWKPEEDAESPETGVRMVSSHHVDAGNRTQVFCESREHSELLCWLCSPTGLLFQATKFMALSHKTPATDTNTTFTLPAPEGF